MNLLSASANRLSACGRALRPWLGRTLLPAAVLDPSGQASLAGVLPCRTGAASFMVAIDELRHEPSLDPEPTWGEIFHRGAQLAPWSSDDVLDCWPRPSATHPTA